ncbi:damage-inducible protein DinB [Fulvivirgaceae bacterium PWU20]|uniref:Damage-inducible protein DinB n=2 Tax=Chryseosolibacter indicus TaxID=2782351 RepID=A0ABS5VP46_9BACT|nr:damage-inducible protein DinB [Chryseosolibacter indicus]
MQLFLRDLFEYNNHSNNTIIKILTENETIVSDHCIKLISHILNVHGIWNHKIAPRELQYERWEKHHIHQLHEINKKNYEDSVSILDSFDPDKVIDYRLSTGQPFRNSIRDILFHVINHSTYHRAQIATEFRQMGLEPLLTDYIAYKMK